MELSCIHLQVGKISVTWMPQNALSFLTETASGYCLWSVITTRQRASAAAYLRCVRGRLWKTCRSMLNNGLDGFKKWSYAVKLKNSGNELYIFEPNVWCDSWMMFSGSGLPSWSEHSLPPRRMSCQPDDIIFLQVGVSVAFWNSDATCIYNTWAWEQWILTWWAFWQSEERKTAQSLFSLFMKYVIMICLMNQIHL